MSTLAAESDQPSRRFSLRTRDVNIGSKTLLDQSSPFKTSTDLFRSMHTESFIGINAAWGLRRLRMGRSLPLPYSDMETPKAAMISDRENALLRLNGILVDAKRLGCLWDAKGAVEFTTVAINAIRLELPGIAEIMIMRAEHIFKARMSKLPPR